MQYRKLGSSGQDVSVVCLGSMTWGQQNTQKDANEQIDYALAQGINFIDTAEMYPVPPNAETTGQTEVILGHWLAANKARRADVLVATKIAGGGLNWIRNGERITPEGVFKAVDSSLKRLQTDYIDLYQLHWPNRPTPHFAKQWPGTLDFTEVDIAHQKEEMLTILQALNDCVQAGKIRHCGLSDETPWGMSHYLRLSEQHALPKMVSIQNEFNVLHWKDWPFLIEHCVAEDIAYLPWSPLAGGMLTGKYLNGARPEGSRWSLLQRMGLFRDTEASRGAICEFVELANSLRLSPAQLALAWVNHVPGVTSTIIGATSITQLKEDIDAFSLSLSASQMEQIQAFILRFPMCY